MTLGGEGSAGGRAARSAPLRLLQQLDHPRQVVSNLTPNWYASVTGTGIIAVAAADLPVQIPGLRTAATVVWALSALLLVGLSVATLLHWLLYRDAARLHHLNPVVSHFYGAPPMALLTVGAGTLLVGRDWIGLPAALGVDWVLWSVGTLLGCTSAVLLPYLVFTSHEKTPRSAFGGWLMPVVPPMVSASTGALLLPHLPRGDSHQTLLWGCFGLFGLSLFCSIIVITQIWSRLAQHSVGQTALVPTLWIVLGPCGQAIAAVNFLADGNGASAVLTGLALVFGFGMLGFALLWTTIASLITVRSFRRGLPFGLTWWSFTFPVGACVVGLDGLALHTELLAVRVLAVVYFIGLLAAWFVVAIGTFHGSVVRGSLFVPPLSTRPHQYDTPGESGGVGSNQAAVARAAATVLIDDRPGAA